MTTQTPVASMWEPRLPERSLVNGLPWPGEDETPISGDSARVLATRQEPGGGMFTRNWISRPRPGMSERRLVTRGGGSLDDYTDCVVRYQVVASGIVSGVIEPPSIEPRTALATIEAIKDRLRVDWDPLIDLLDVPRRTFFTYRKKGALPTNRVSEIGARANLLAQAMDEDEDTARILVATRRPELKRLLAEARFNEARELFAALRLEVEATRSGVSREATLAGAGRQLDAIASIVDRPGFEAAARAFTVISAKATTYRLERFQAWVEVERSIEHARSGGDLDERWGFLPVLRFAEMDDLRERARAFAESDAFSPETWSAFVHGESDKAWAAYNPVILPPDPPEPLPAFVPTFVPTDATADWDREGTGRRYVARVGR